MTRFLLTFLVLCDIIQIVNKIATHVPNGNINDIVEDCNMDKFDNLTNLDKALIAHLKQLSNEGRIPKVDFEKVNSLDGLRAFLKDTVFAEHQAPEQPVEPAKQPAEHAEENDGFAPRIHVFHLTRKVPAPEIKDEQDNDSIMSILSYIGNNLDALEQTYRDLYRTRSMLHAMRDTPDLSNPMHVCNLVECSNEMHALGSDTMAQMRVLSAISSTYESFAAGREAFTAAFRKGNDLLRRILPLAKMLEDKVEDALGENWDAFESDCGEDCECCCGCFEPGDYEDCCGCDGCEGCDGCCGPDPSCD